MKKAQAPSAEAIAMIVLVMVVAVISAILLLKYKGTFGSEYFRSFLGK